MKQRIKDLGIDFRGVLVRHYTEQVESNRKADSDFFERMTLLKDLEQKQLQKQSLYEQTLQDNALFDRYFKDTDVGTQK